MDRSETTRRDVASLCLLYKPNGPIETINGRFGHLYSVTLGGRKLVITSTKHSLFLAVQLRMSALKCNEPDDLQSWCLD